MCYPAYSSRVFATCAVEDIRVWDARSKSELVRIRVPNLECRAIAITASGATLVSGWSDGKLRLWTRNRQINLGHGRRPRPQ